MFQFTRLLFLAVVAGLTSYFFPHLFIHKPCQCSSEITLVTAFYPQPGYNPKYPDMAFYRSRVQEFLASIRTPIVVFAPSSEEQFLRSSRPEGFPMLIDHTYETVWDIPYLTPLMHSFHTTQRKLALHSTDMAAVNDTGHMYGVWNSKVFFVNTTAERNPFNSSYFFWQDAAGYWSPNDSYTAWPDPHRIRTLLAPSQGNQDAVLMNVRELRPCFTQKKDLLLRNAPLTRTIAGVFFGGSKKSISWLTQRFYEMLQYYHSLGEFVGVEEQLLLAIATLDPSKVVSIPGYLYHDPEFQSLDHVWFYTNYLARPEEVLNGMRELPEAPNFNDVPLYPPCGGARGIKS